MDELRAMHLGAAAAPAAPSVLAALDAAYRQAQRRRPAPIATEKR